MVSKTSRKQQVEVEIKEHSISTTERPYWRAIVTTARGYCYCCTWAGDKPSEETVRQTWAEDRKAFDPYCS